MAHLRKNPLQRTVHGRRELFGKRNAHILVELLCERLRLGAVFRLDRDKEGFPRDARETEGELALRRGYHGRLPDGAAEEIGDVDGVFCDLLQSEAPAHERSEIFRILYALELFALRFCCSGVMFLSQ